MALAAILMTRELAAEDEYASVGLDDLGFCDAIAQAAGHFARWQEAAKVVWEDAATDWESLLALLGQRVRNAYGKGRTLTGKQIATFCAEKVG